jgi:hypothetical protein
MSEFRESVRRDAIKAGHSPEVADWIADAVTNPPSREAVDAMPWCMRRLHRVEAYASQRREPLDTLARIAALFGPRASALTSELRAAGLPLRKVVAALIAAAGSARELTESGADSVRARLQSLHYWGGN